VSVEVSLPMTISDGNDPGVSNYAAVLHGANDMRFEKAPVLGTIKPDQVRINIKAVGICGTDVHLFHQARRLFVRARSTLGSSICG